MVTPITASIFIRVPHPMRNPIGVPFSPNRRSLGGIRWLTYRFKAIVSVPSRGIGRRFLLQLHHVADNRCFFRASMGRGHCNIYHLGFLWCVPFHPHQLRFPGRNHILFRIGCTQNIENGSCIMVWVNLAASVYPNSGNDIRICAILIVPGRYLGLAYTARGSWFTGLSRMVFFAGAIWPIRFSLQTRTIWGVVTAMLLLEINTSQPQLIDNGSVIYNPTGRGLFLRPI